MKIMLYVELAMLAHISVVLYKFYELPLLTYFLLGLLAGIKLLKLGGSK